MLPEDTPPILRNLEGKTPTSRNQNLHEIQVMNPTLKTNAITTVLRNWRSLRNWTMAAAFAVPLTLLTTTSLRAGTITVVDLPATGTDVATGITTNKHYVCALDFGNYGSPPGNINGVRFYHVSPNNTATNLTGADPNFGGGFVLSCGNTTNASFTGKLNSTSSTTQGSPNSQADGNMRLMLYDLMFVTAAAPPSPGSLRSMTTSPSVTPIPCAFTTAIGGMLTATGCKTFI
jgi:hypothetical protein